MNAETTDSRINCGRTAFHRALVRLIDMMIRSLWWLRAKVDPEGTKRWRDFLDGAAVMAHVHGMRP